MGRPPFELRVRKGYGGIPASTCAEVKEAMRKALHNFCVKLPVLRLSYFARRACKMLVGAYVLHPYKIPPMHRCGVSCLNVLCGELIHDPHIRERHWHVYNINSDL